MIYSFLFFLQLPGIPAENASLFACYGLKTKSKQNQMADLPIRSVLVKTHILCVIPLCSLAYNRLLNPVIITEELSCVYFAIKVLIIFGSI